MADASTAASWVTTLIQIGIPSAVTVVSILFSAKVSKAGQQKDIEIAKLTIEERLRIETRDRQAELIKHIAGLVTNIEIAIGKYSGAYRSGVSEQDAPFTHEIKHRLAVAFEELSAAIAECFGVATSASLLADPKISSGFEKFQESLFIFQRAANPETALNRETLQYTIDMIRCDRIQLMELLSELYLGKRS